MLFQTQRLTIRPLSLDDFDPFFEMQGNPNVLKYVGRNPQNKEECRADLKECIDYYQKKNNGFWVWAVIRKSDNVFVGTGAIIIDEHQKGEIGYRFLEKHWGNGYGSEVMEGLVEYGFKIMKVKTLFAVADVLNVGSIKILEKSELPFIKEFWNEEDQCTDRHYELDNPFL